MPGAAMPEEPRRRQRVVVAEIGGAHGVEGLVRLIPHTELPEAVESLEGLCLGESGRACRIRLVKPLKRGWAARVEGIESREAAAALSGEVVTAPRESLGRTEEAEAYFLADLIGAQAAGPDGRRLGVVRAAPNFGAGDLIELDLDEPVKDFGKSVLLPFDRRYVTEIDAEAGRMTIDLERWLAEQG